MMMERKPIWTWLRDFGRDHAGRYALPWPGDDVVKDAITRTYDGDAEYLVRLYVYAHCTTMTLDNRDMINAARMTIWNNHNRFMMKVYENEGKETLAAMYQHPATGEGQTSPQTTTIDGEEYEVRYGPGTFLGDG